MWGWARSPRRGPRWMSPRASHRDRSNAHWQASCSANRSISGGARPSSASPPDWKTRPPQTPCVEGETCSLSKVLPPPSYAGLSHMTSSVVSTEGRRPEWRDLLSTISRLLLREGLSASRFALRSRRRKSPGTGDLHKEVDEGPELYRQMAL